MALYTRTEDGWMPSELTIGPWDPRHQHGGPPAGLLVREAEHYEGGDAFVIARVTLELLAPVPLTWLRTQIEPIKLGRTVQRLRVRLLSRERILVDGTVLRIARSAGPASNPLPLQPWPLPESCGRFEFPFFGTESGYHKAVELRIAHGAWGRTPIGMWARTSVPLVDGEAISPLQSLLVLADAQSGMGAPVDPLQFSYVNPDLTVYLQRRPEPRDGWFGFDIRSYSGSHGSGLAQSSIRDAAGEVGRSAQSLVIRARQ
jgi:hypothetical protein